MYAFETWSIIERDKVSKCKVNKDIPITGHGGP
jgi:hypothetical protein